jgi:hypothetical protein
MGCAVYQNRPPLVERERSAGLGFFLAPVPLRAARSASWGGWRRFAIIVDSQTHLRVALNGRACVRVALLQIGKRPPPAIGIAQDCPGKVPASLSSATRAIADPEYRGASGVLQIVDVALTGVLTPQP